MHIIKIFLLILIFHYSFEMIIFPFRTAIYNSDEAITQKDKEYNISNYILDNYYQPNYISIKIGNPPQEIKVLLTFNDCGFKVGKANKCIYRDDYLSHYNRNLSSDFRYTNYYNKTREFLKGKSAQDSLYAFTDLSMKKLKKFENIGFYLGTDTNDALCGIIGFKSDIYDFDCNEVNNIFNSFQLNQIIKTDNWILKYNSRNEGLLILDPDMEKIIKKFNNNKLLIINSEKEKMYNKWGVSIDKVLIQSDDQIIKVNKKKQIAEITNDFGLISGSSEYYYNITRTYFKDYILKRICTLDEYHPNVYYYFALECDKEKFGIEDMKKFPKLSLVIIPFEKEFVFDYKDLFTETEHKYFFDVVFNKYITESWILGKPFLRKYPLLFNYKSKTIGFYNEEIKIDLPTKDGNNYSEKLFVLLIIIILLIIIFGGISFYYIIPNLKRIKKRKANELVDDDFDYTSSNENQNSLIAEKSSEK